MAGAVSAVFTTPILAPGERVKCLLQVQAGQRSADAAAKGGGPASRCCLWVPPRECADLVGAAAHGLRGELLLTEQRG